MMHRLFALALVVGLIPVWGSCGKKNGPDPAVEAARPPVAPLPPKAVTPPPVVPREPEVVRSADGLGGLIDRFNACIGAVAEGIRATDAIPTSSATQIGDCDKLFNEILSTGKVVVSEPYADYFVLAAKVMDRLRSGRAAPGDPAPAFSTKDFITEYNQFALKNNELMGIPVVEAAEADVARKVVPRRTFRDELARLGETLATAVRDWQFAHRFETLGSGAPSSWLSAVRVERVRFWMLRLTLEDQLAAFGRFDCDNAGTGPEEKITCDTLVGAGRDLAKSGKEWLDAWSLLLGTLASSPGAFPEAARKACDARQEALEEKIRELPGRIE